MKQFEVGKIYYCFSPGNTDCRWLYRVMHRTAKTISVIDDHGAVKKLRIVARESMFNDCECVFPLGHYSLAPMLTAD